MEIGAPTTTSISKIPAELQLRLCEFLPVEDIVKMSEILPNWRWIRGSRWFKCLVFRRCAHWTWVDRHICRQLRPQSAPTYFFDPLGTLNYHKRDKTLFELISLLSRLVVNDNYRIEFKCLVFTSIWPYMEIVSSSGNRVPMDIHHMCTDLIGQLTIKTHIRVSFSEPLYTIFWEKLYKLQHSDGSSEWNVLHRRMFKKAAQISRRIYLQAVRHLISPVDAVIYIVYSTESLKSDVEFLVDQLKSEQVLIIVIPTDGNHNTSTNLASLIRHFECLGGLTNSKLASTQVYWRLFCLQVGSDGHFKSQDVDTCLHCPLISRRFERRLSNL